jgi:anti-sigma regulatory factor (Ser/Thr protein kinase)
MMPNFDKATTVVIPLHADLDAPSTSRRFLAEHTPGWPSDLVDDALLLVSELVTNAVTHGRPEITLQVCLRPASIGVGVADQGAKFLPEPGHDVEADALHGRGLMLVGEIATEWGVSTQDEGPGKTVWFTLEESV